MSTRGLIAIEKTDKTCISSYCHHDCYPSGVGLCLTQHYKTLERAEALLKLGPLSVLGDRLSSDDPEPNAQSVCIAYHRDRGEEFQTPTVWPNADEMLAKAADRFWAEYVYLFRDGRWYVDAAYQPKGWRRVEDVLREHDDE